MTTTQQSLPGAVATSVEAAHENATMLRRFLTRVPVTVVAIDLVAVSLPAIAVSWLFDAWSPALQLAVPVAWLVLVTAFGGYGGPSTDARDRPRARAVWPAACGLALALWSVAAILPGLFGDVQATARAVLAVALLAPLNTLGLRRAASVDLDDAARDGVVAPGRVVKDAVDRVCAAVLLIVLAPLIAALFAIVRLDSPGSALFRQTRVGRGGRTFTMLKLRTMHAGAECDVDLLASANECEPASLLFKIRRDPRLTPIGAVLRRYSLDELPQLVNVLRGEMSLVGPRPALPSEARFYTEAQRRRLDVMPGMTGLWQVSGRSDLSWDEAVRLDLAYVDNWSWRMDLAIIARTFGAVIRHRGAY